MQTADVDVSRQAIKVVGVLGKGAKESHSRPAQHLTPAHTADAL
jgi:hypothetical protein